MYKIKITGVCEHTHLCTYVEAKQQCPSDAIHPFD